MTSSTSPTASTVSYLKMFAVKKTKFVVEPRGSFFRSYKTIILHRVCTTASRASSISQCHYRRRRRRSRHRRHLRPSSVIQSGLLLSSSPHRRFGDGRGTLPKGDGHSPGVMQIFVFDGVRKVVSSVPRLDLQAASRQVHVHLSPFTRRRPRRRHRTPAAAATLLLDVRHGAVPSQYGRSKQRQFIVWG
jgi:hypothetical protein